MPALATEFLESFRVALALPVVSDIPQVEAEIVAAKSQVETLSKSLQNILEQIKEASRPLIEDSYPKIAKEIGSRQDDVSNGLGREQIQALLAEVKGIAPKSGHLVNQKLADVFASPLRPNLGVHSERVENYLRHSSPKSFYQDLFRYAISVALRPLAVILETKGFDVRGETSSYARDEFLEYSKVYSHLKISDEIAELANQYGLRCKELFAEVERLKRAEEQLNKLKAQSLWE